MDSNPPGGLSERLRRPPSRRDLEAGTRRRRLFLTLASGLVLLGVILLARPAYDRLLQWRARGIVSQAQELIRQQLFPEAIEKLESALRVNPRSTDALRALADVYSRFELPAAMPIYRALAAAPDRTEADLHTYIEATLKLQRFDLTETELSRLLAEPKISPTTRLLATEFFFRLGDFPRALSFANELRRADPTNNANQLRAAKILLNMPGPDRQRDAITLLANLTNLSKTDRVNLAELLASAAALPREPVKELLRRFPLTAESETLEYFLRADVDLRLDPLERTNVVTAALTRYRGGTPQQRSELCLWLLRLGEHDRIVQAYTPEEAIEHPEILLVYLEALGKSGNWGELKRLVETDLPLEAWQLETLRAHAASQLDQGPLAEEHWRRAFAAVTDSPARLRTLGDFALRLGAVPTATKAFKLLADNKLYRGSALRRLALIYQQQRNATELHATMHALALSGDNPFAENAYCYLSALLFKDVESAYPRSRKLFEAMPTRVVHRSTLAFLELRRGDQAAALRLFDRAAFDLQTSNPQTRFVYALVLEANGQATRAREVLKDLKTDQFLPEEMELMKGLARPEPAPSAGTAKTPTP